MYHAVCHAPPVLDVEQTLPPIKIAGIPVHHSQAQWKRLRSTVRTLHVPKNADVLKKLRNRRTNSDRRFSYMDGFG